MPNDLHKGNNQQNSKEQTAHPEVPTPLPSDLGVASKRDPQEKTDHPAHYAGYALKKLWRVLVWAWSILPRNSAFWTGTATVVIAISTVFYTIYARKQWHAISKQIPALQASANATKSAADSAIASIRPWIKTGVRLTGPLVFNKGGGASIQVLLAIQNVGHSPALNVEPNIGLFAVHDNSLAKDIRTDQTKFLGCRNYLSTKTKSLISTFGTNYPVVFPNNSPLVAPYKLTMDARQVKAGLFYLPGPHRPFINLAIIGCVPYGQSFSYETGFVFELAGFAYRPGTVLGNIRLMKPSVNFGTYAH